MISKIRDRRARRARLEELRRELEALRGQLADAYGLFNRTADPALLEASILEISALQVRYDRLLRSIKDIHREVNHDHRCDRSSGRRAGPDLPAAAAAPQADQVGL